MATHCGINSMKKILIIYELTGAGHERVAAILEEILAGIPGNSVESIAGSTLFNDPGARLINRMWSFLIRHDLIRLADLLINYLFRIFGLPVVEVLQTGKYRRILARLKPDLIICTADGYGKLLSGYAYDHSIPCVLVNTEVSVFLDMASPHATHICYFRETVAAVRSLSFWTTYYTTHLNEHTSLLAKLTYVGRMYRDHGLPWRWKSIRRIPGNTPRRLNSAACHAVGPIVSPEHFEKRPCQAMRRKHGIATDHPCVFIASGSLGGRFLLRILDVLILLQPGPLTVVALCGRDRRTLEQIRSTSSAISHIDILPLGFVDEVSELLAAADVVIARPSAGIFLEALIHRVPILLPARTTSNDAGAVCLTRQHGLGCIYENPREIPDLLTQLLEAREQYGSDNSVLQQVLSDILNQHVETDPPA